MVKSLYPIFSILVFTLNLYAGQLSGTISDSVNSLIHNAHIVLTGQSPTSYNDSTYSDSFGNYSFLSFPVGSYTLVVTNNGYYPVDTSVLLSDGTQTINFKLRKLNGVYHSGNVSGIWLASDNPHIIIGEVTVVDSLYIAPGCTVENLTGKVMLFYADANLRIGNLASNRTILSNLYFLSRSKGSQIISIANSSLQNCTINDLQGNYIIFDSVNCGFISLMNTNINCNQFILNNSNLQGGLEYDPITGTGPSFWLTVASKKISISNSFFNYLPLAIDSCDSLKISYCYFNEAYSELWLVHLASYANISHSNIGLLTLYEFNNFNIADCIINSVSFFGLSDTTYNSPFNHCIINSVSLNPIFGLLTPLRVNNNNDSCDLWFNMKTDPLFATAPVLKNGSPAIGAASDGLNIGYYQGPVATIKHGWKNTADYKPQIKIISRRPLIISTANSGLAKIKCYNLQGKLLFSKNINQGSILSLQNVVNAHSTCILELSSGKGKVVLPINLY